MWRSCASTTQAQWEVDGGPCTRPVDPPKNLTATMERLTEEGRQAARVTPTWAAPDGVSGITGCRILRTDGGHPMRATRQTARHTSYDYDYSRYGHEIATVGGNTLTYADGAGEGLRDPSLTFRYTCCVAAITADGDSFPAKVSVSP